MAEVIDTIQTQERAINKNKHSPYKCNLQAIRQALGLSRNDLARELGKTNNFICMIEHKKYYPTLTMRIKIAKALETDTSAVWVLREVDENEK